MIRGGFLMRSAKACDNFPYRSKQICYFQVDKNGEVSQLQPNISEMETAYQSASLGNTTIYAVQPGDYKSDLFIIDDINILADAFGVDRPDSHIHDITWCISSCDDGKSRYADIQFKFNCGCKLNENNIRKFANDMRKQMGWNVAVTTGFGYHSSKENDTIYSISVLRKSLTK